MSGPLLDVEGLAKVHGRGCDRCLEATGPEARTNACSFCGSVVACARVSFEVGAGEVLGIVGESGSGKSTVAGCLTFDVEPSAGEARFGPFGGQNFFRADAAQKRRLRDFEIGLVYQDARRGLDLDVSAGGTWPSGSWRRDGATSGDAGRASELLDRSEIPVGRIDEPPRHFSGGMRQRVQLAKALANRPSLLVLDEPTTGLDVSVQARILDLIREIQRDAGVATIVISHDLGVVRLLTERTLVMRHGRVVEAGLTDQILEDPQHPYTQLLVSSVL